MSVSPRRPRRVPSIQRPTGGESGNGDDATDDQSTLARAKSESGRFSLLLIDNVTGKATRVNMKPLRLDTILKTNLRDRRLLMGWLHMNLVEAARRLWPGFAVTEEHKPLTGYPIQEHREEPPDKPFLPVWRRHRLDDFDDEGGI